MKRKLAALAALLLLESPLVVSAQVPSYAISAYGDDQQIRGRVANFDGGYNLQVRDDRGYVDNVQLHDGTIINPTGLALAPGMVVSIVGYNTGPAFAANEIDTPYAYYQSVPYYSGHPWNYYGSDITLGFFFGNTGWWHGNDFSGGYAYDRGVRVYGRSNVRNFYNGGAFQGRNYVAPAGRGGYARGQSVNTNLRTANGTTTHNSTYNAGAYAPQTRAYTPQTRAYAPQQSNGAHGGPSSTYARGNGTTRGAGTPAGTARGNGMQGGMAHGGGAAGAVRGGGGAGGMAHGGGSGAGGGQRGGGGEHGGGSEHGGGGDHH